MALTYWLHEIDGMETNKYHENIEIWVRTLETIYISFRRPLLEYGDIIFDNCTAYEKQKLDKIQSEAARIVTSATKLVALEKLSIEW